MEGIKRKCSEEKARQRFKKGMFIDEKLKNGVLYKDSL